VENIITRYRNVTILVAVLFAQVLGLAMQVKRSTDSESTLLIRVWAVAAVTPLEKAFVFTTHGVRGVWRNYFYLRGVRAENRALQEEISQLRLQQARMAEDAAQARRLQLLLGFKEQFISQTLPAQVIGSSGSDQSRIIYIDKGTRDGMKPDMPVITDQGIVGKVLRVFHSSSQVLLVNDVSSGVGAILEKSRLQGVLKGSPSGDVILDKVMSDEQVEPGERVLTSGGDRIFPKGLLIGYVRDVKTGADLFLKIRVRLTANLSKVEEVLVITKVDEREPSSAELNAPVRAIDILANRLPSVPEKPATDPPGTKAAAGASSSTPVAGTATTKPGPTEMKAAKPKTAGTPAAAATVLNGADPAVPKSKPATSTSTTARPRVKPAATETPAGTGFGAGNPRGGSGTPVNAADPAPANTAPLRAQPTDPQGSQENPGQPPQARRH
jgi:rod shape-determining protein MreC